MRFFHAIALAVAAAASSTGEYLKRWAPDKADRGLTMETHDAKRNMKEEADRERWLLSWVVRPF